MPAHHSRKRTHPTPGQSSGIGNLAMQDRLKSRSPYRISHHQDPHERDADRMADRVMAMGGSDAPVTSSLSATANPPKGVQRKSEHSPAPSAAISGATALPGSGRALPTATRAFFEARFGRDLSQVRIHDDPATHETAQSLNARAFTQSNHIGFDTGQYSPDSREGRHLLAHELAHVSQQTDANTVYRETWNVDDSNREVERGLLVQLIFEDTWTDMWSGTGWTEARKNTFRSNFISSIENTFNSSNVVLRPPASAADVLPPANIAQGYKPLVDIQLVPEGEFSIAEDWEVDVSSNPNSEFRTSSSSTRYGTLDEADNTPIAKTSSAPGVTQIPTVHEFGHFIGLDHPGEGLEGNWFSPSQLSPGADEYSHTGTDAEGRTVHGPTDLMGGGMGLRPFYFDAWAEALDDHIAELRRQQSLEEMQRAIDELFHGRRDMGDFPAPTGGSQFG